MIDEKPSESYYDILKVHPKATTSEIVAAYHATKNAFSKESVATYSLFSAGELKAILEKIEEAYQNLGNIDKRRDYDRRVGLASQSQLAASPSEKTLSPRAPKLGIGIGSGIGTASSVRERQLPTEHRFETKTPHEIRSEAEKAAVNTLTVTHPIEPLVNRAKPDCGDQITGMFLKTMREYLNLTEETVSQITKIQTRCIRAIENDDIKRFPARVYLQGFIKNLATVYKLNPQDTAKSYLDYIEKKYSDTQGF